MSINDTEFDKEWCRQQSFTSRVDRLIDLIDANEAIESPDNTQQYVIFVTGRSGAGKTTLGESFNVLPNFVHFDGDQFAHGADPVNQSGKGAEKELLATREDKLVNVYDNLLVPKGYYAIFDNKDPPLAVWAPFYEQMIAKLKQVIKHENSLIANTNNDIDKNNNAKRATVQIDEKKQDCITDNTKCNIIDKKHFIITQSAYRYKLRQYLRKLFIGSKKLKFITVILDTSVDLLVERVRKRTEKQATDAGMTYEKYLEKWGITAEEWDEKMRIHSRGFQPMMPNEENTIQITVDSAMTTQNVFDQVKKQLNIEFGLQIE